MIHLSFRTTKRIYVNISKDIIKKPEGDYYMYVTFYLAE